VLSCWDSRDTGSGLRDLCDDGNDRPTREIKQAVATVDRDKEVGKYERQDGHQLHHDVECRSRSVLERVTNGVADDGSLVQVRALPLLDPVDDNAALK
jgi:hypothetical protein